MLWLIPLTPLLLAPLLYLAGGRVDRRGLVLMTALAILATLALAVTAVAGEWSGGYAWSPLLALTLELSPAGRLFMLTVPAVALPILIFAGFHDIKPDQPPAVGARLLALLLAFVGAMELLVVAGDLLTLLIAWELVGACSWGLICHRWGESAVPTDAAQAFLVTRFGDLGLYIAAAALFAGTGGFGYGNLSALDGPLLQLAAGGMLLAAAAKSAQVPFSPWLFAAMSGPVSVSALLHSATMVAAGIFLLARLEPFLSEVAWFAPLVMGIGLATALAAGVVAVYQGHAKKLLAASTSAQYGLMWMAVGAGYPGVALVHFMAHAFLKGGLFLSTGVAEHQSGSYALDSMGLGRRLPGLAAATLVMALALAGLAPLGAAWSKEQIASAVASRGTAMALLVALAGGISALYATRFQRLAYGRPPQPDFSTAPGASLPEKGALYAMAAVTLVASLLWWPAVHEPLATWLGMAWPEGHHWLLAVSLGLVLVGIGLGIAMTRPGRSAAPEGRRALVAGWFGLPRLIAGLARSFSRLSGCLARFDDRWIGGAVGALAGTVLAGARCLARFDDAVVDGGLRRTAALGQWLAGVNATRSEALAEGIPGGLARLTDRGGGWARAAQSGQTHHYYTGIGVGLVILLMILMMGAFS